VRGESYADAHIGEGVFEDEVPADDPGDQFAEGGVGVGIGRAGDGDHGSELGVTEAGEDADDGDEDQREGESGACAGTSGHGGVREQVVNQGSVADLRGVELLACHGGADDGEDAGTDDSANAESRERPGAQGLFQRMLGIFGFADQLIDGFAGKQLIGQGGSPVIAEGPGAWVEAFWGSLHAEERRAEQVGRSWRRTKQLRAATSRYAARNMGELCLQGRLALRHAAHEFPDLLLV
jgi:hypothetical protein